MAMNLTSNIQYPTSTPRVAIVHYWLDSYRGGEKVIEALCEIYPKADIFTHIYKPANLPKSITSHKVFTTFISKLPLANKFYRHYLLLMPLALWVLDLKKYDLIISSESGPAKGIRKRSDALHICYCHSPMRYIWDMQEEYLGKFKSSEVRKCGSSEVRKCVSAEVRKCVSAEVRKCVSAEVRKCVSAEVRKCGSAEVRKFGSSEVRKCGSSEVRKCESAGVRKFGSAKVRKFGSAKVRKFGSSEVRKCESSEVRKCESSEVRKFGSAEVRECGSSGVRKFESAEVREFESAEVRKCESSEVRKCGSAKVRKCGSAEVRKCGSSEVRKFGSAEVRKFGSVGVRKFGSSEVRKCGSSEVRKCVSAEVRKCVSAEVRKCVSAEVRKCGSAKFKKQNNSFLFKIQNLKLKIIIIQFLWKIIACYMRCWDRTSAQKVDYFIVNSKFISARVRKFYKRKSTVIHPPVDINKFNPKNKKNNTYLCVSQLVTYKKVKMVVEAFNILGLPLCVIGGGNELEDIKKIAKDNIQVLGKVTDKILKEKFETCKAFVYAGKEDFGIVFAEALSAGTPIIAYRKGGVKDIVENNKTGIFFAEQTISSICKAVNKFESNKVTMLSSEDIAKTAERFSIDCFKKKIIEFIGQRI